MKAGDDADERNITLQRWSYLYLLAHIDKRLARRPVRKCQQRRRRLA